MLLRHALLAAAVAALTSASASATTGVTDESRAAKRDEPPPAPAAGVRRLSEDAVSRRMARARRILQAAAAADDDDDSDSTYAGSVPTQTQQKEQGGNSDGNSWIGDSTDYSQNSSIAEVTIEDFLKILDSDAAEEFGYKEDMTPDERAAVTKRWEEYAIWDYTRAVAAEEAYYAGNNDTTVVEEEGDMLYAYVVCNKNGGSAFDRKGDIYEYVVANMGDIDDGGVDLATDDDFKTEYLDKLETVYNMPEMTCSFGKFRASIIAVIAGKFGVGVVPLNTYMKVRGGVVNEILKLAFPNNTKDDTKDMNSSDMDDMADEDPNISAEQSKIDVVVCQGVTQGEIDRLSTKLINFMVRKTADGSSFVAAQSPYANLTDAEVEDMPDRVRFWRNAFRSGIDSEIGCANFLRGLRSEVHSSSSGNGDDSATVRIQLMDITANTEDENEDYNDVACTLGLVWGLALLPQVCSLEMTKTVDTGAAAGTGNAESQWITQGGVSTGQSSNTQHTSSRPFWESGIQGEGQVVAISDSGIDVNHCYFYDESIGMKANVDYTTLSHRKVVQYDPFVDDEDEPAGHGTHTAGTVAGHLSTDKGTTESDGLEDGVARNAKIAFIDCGKSCGPGCGTLNIPPTDRLMETGKEAGAKLHSASWGISFIRQNIPYRYDTQARNIDSYTYKNWDMLMVAAAGNDGRSGPNSMNSPGVAKNVLAVGAGYTSRNNPYGDGFVVDFSSEGPTPDGRIAPQIVAPGSDITSSEARPDEVGECEADGALISKSGTSMATPAVSGAAALARQYFVDRFYPTGVKSPDNDSIDPSGTLIKAVIINSGQAMDGKVQKGATIGSVPYDNIQGFGRISLTSTLRLSGQSDIVSRVVDRVDIKDGESMTYAVVVNSTICEGRELRATLVWADPPGASGCIVCSINDLDLELTNELTNEKYYPNGGTNKDYINNVERIIVPTSALSNGESWTAKVTAANLDRASQGFSLVMSGCFNFDGQDDIKFAQPSAPGRGESSTHILSAFLATAVALLATVCLLA